MGEAAGARAAGFGVEAMVAAYAELSSGLTRREREQSMTRTRCVLLTTNLARGGAETQVAELAGASGGAGGTSA